MLLRMGLLLRLGPNVITDGTFITLGSSYYTCAFWLIHGGAYFRNFTVCDCWVFYGIVYGMMALLKVREISYDVLFCIFSIFFIKRGYFWRKYGHFYPPHPPPHWSKFYFDPPPPRPFPQWSKFYLWKTKFSLHDESINKDFLKSQTGASYTIRTKKRIKSCQVTASFCKRNAISNNKSQKQKEIEDVKLLLCR